MARIPYGEQTAAAYQTAREIPLAGLTPWHEAVRRHLAPTQGMALLDVGAGTGAFAAAFCDWFDVLVLAVEPSDAMRSKIPRRTGIEILAGRAEALPVTDACAHGAWLSTVIHHISDLTAAASELRRVLRPGAPVLIRNAFPGRCDRITLVRYFPETARVIDTYPTVEQVCHSFATAGFEPFALEAVPQQTAPSLAEFLGRLRRDADTLLRGITDEEFAHGIDRLRGAVREEAAGGAQEVQVIDWLDLLVLQ